MSIWPPLFSMLFEPSGDNMKQRRSMFFMLKRAHGNRQWMLCQERSSTLVLSTRNHSSCYQSAIGLSWYDASEIMDEDVFLETRIKQAYCANAGSPKNIDSLNITGFTQRSIGYRQVDSGRRMKPNAENLEPRHGPWTSVRYATGILCFWSAIIRVKMEK